MAITNTQEMKKEKYHGLKTLRSTVESAPLMDASKVQIQAKTRSTNWQEEHVTNKEFGMDEMAIPTTGNRQDYWSTEF